MVSFERLTRGQGSCSRGTSRRVRTSKGEGARNAAAGLNAPTGKWCDECRRGGHATEECWSKENSGTQDSTEENTVL